mmetsp:Transcript_8737/g.19193  ORF Transcript_8737/g.19193 Transcript_8737/m.19193 type:complete len:245 (+) Transcript_8737:102-836(+)
MYSSSTRRRRTLVRADVLYSSRDQRLARHITVLVYATIASAIHLPVDELTLLLFLLPLPFLAFTISVFVDALSVLTVLLPLPFVAPPVTPLVNSLSVLFALLPLPFVATTIPPLVQSLSVPLASQPLTVIADIHACRPRCSAEPVTLSSPHLPGVCGSGVTVSSRVRTRRNPLHVARSLFIHRRMKNRHAQLQPTTVYLERRDCTLHRCIFCLHCCALYLHCCAFCLHYCDFCLACRNSRHQHQ